MRISNFASTPITVRRVVELDDHEIVRVIDFGYVRIRV